VHRIAATRLSGRAEKSNPTRAGTVIADDATGRGPTVPASYEMFALTRCIALLASVMLLDSEGYAAKTRET
jgi:hypothetical protein